MVNEVEVEDLNAEHDEVCVYTIDHEVNVVDLSQSVCEVKKIKEKKAREWDPRTQEQTAREWPEMFAELERVWRCYVTGDEICDGPVATVHSAPTLYTREGRPHLRLLDGPESWWLYEVRQGVRLAEWTKRGTDVTT